MSLDFDVNAESIAAKLDIPTDRRMYLELMEQHNPDVPDLLEFGRNNPFELVGSGYVGCMVYFFVNQETGETQIHNSYTLRAANKKKR